MIYTVHELAAHLGERIRARRIAQKLTQADAAKKSGVSYATWRRLEAEGKASVEDLARAAILLRCESELVALFPLPLATTMDELIKSQQKKLTPKRVRTPKIAAL